MKAQNTDKNKKFACPFCTHRALRNWNMKVHIIRWHKDEDGDKGPFYLGDQTKALLKSKKNQHSPGAPKKPEPKSIFEPVHELYRKWSSAISDAKEAQREMIEMRGFLGNLPLSYPPQIYMDENMGNFAPDSRDPPIFDNPTPSFHANTLSPSFSSAPPDTDSRETRKEEIWGCKAWICIYCTKIVMETFYTVEESGHDLSIITRNNHICSPLPKCSTLQDRVLLAREFGAKLVKLPLELKKAVRGWTGMGTYLVALKQPLENVTSYIVDIYTSTRATANQYKQIHQWALRVIENGGNGQIILNDDDLIDFLEIAHKKTFGYFRIHPRHPADNSEDKTDKSSVNSEIYLMFINNGPLPNVNFNNNSTNIEKVIGQ